MHPLGAAPARTFIVGNPERSSGPHQPLPAGHPIRAVKTAGVLTYQSLRQVCQDRRGLDLPGLEKIINVVVTEGGIRPYFDVLQSGEHVSHGKPHPEIFLVTAEKMGMTPESCAVVEDTAVGIQAAKAAGMYAIAYAAPGAPKHDFREADMVARSFTDKELDTVLLSEIRS